MIAAALSRNGNAVLWIFPFIAFLASCTPKADIDLVGTYQSHYGVANESLTLNADGTYKQEVRLNSPQRIDVATGSWKFDSSSGDITFNGRFHLVLNGYHDFQSEYWLRPNGLVIKPSTKLFGRMSIGSSEGVLYKRVSP